MSILTSNNISQKNKIIQIQCKNCMHLIDYIEQIHCPFCNAYQFGYKSVADYILKEIDSIVEPQNKSVSLSPGCLFIHDEIRETKRFEITKVEMIIGRSTSDYTPDIPLEGDNYISRQHALIKTFQKDNSFISQVQDNLKDGKGSLNGTYINGKLSRLKSTEVYVLKDEDTIQIGETKLVFLSGSSIVNPKEALTRIEEIPYMPTVIIDVKNIKK